MTTPSATAGGTFGPGPRTKVRRLPERARYDRETVNAILDEGFVCHLGVCDGGQAVVVPTNYARSGDLVYLHGAPASSVLAKAIEGAQVCLTVTLVDGLVLARSAFHHSVNYRSVMLFGRAEEVTDPAEKRLALDALVEHIVPGRGRDARPPSTAELRATRVLRVRVEEASAKVRTGGPQDDPDDMLLQDVWAGELPFRTLAGPPVPDPEGRSTPPVPAYLASYRRGRN